MKEITLIPGAGNTPEGGAFDLEKMEEAGVDSALLSQALAKALQPFAFLLRDGCGFGVVDKGESVSVIGLKVEDDGEDPGCEGA